MADSGRTIFGSGPSTGPAYDYDGETGFWSVTPGRTPGCAQFRVAGGGYSDAATPGNYLDHIPLETMLENPDVATLLPDGQSIAFAARGLYLISIRGAAAYYGVGAATVPETYLTVATRGPHGPMHEWSNIDPDVVNNQAPEFATSIPSLCLDGADPFSNLYLTLFGQTHSWAVKVEITIVRLD